MDGNKTLLYGSHNHVNFGDELLAHCFVELTNVPVNIILKKDTFTTENPKIKIFRNRKKALEGVKHLVLGGGGYLGSPTEKISKWDLNFFFRIVEIFRLRQSVESACVYGAGSGPLSSISRLLLKITLRRFNVVAVRDEESQLFLQGVIGYDINVVRDLASFTEVYSNFKLDRIISDRYIILHDIPRHLCDKIIVECKRKYKVILLSDSESVDSWLDSMQDFESEHVIAEKYVSMLRTLALVKHSSLVLTRKLHVGIVSTTFGVPTLSMPKHIKTYRYYKSIGNTHLIDESFDATGSVEDWISTYAVDKLFTKESYNDLIGPHLS